MLIPRVAVDSLGRFAGLTIIGRTDRMLKSSGAPYLAFWHFASAGQQVFHPLSRFGWKIFLDLIDARHRPA
jgi:hypothetical protein